MLFQRNDRRAPSNNVSPLGEGDFQLNFKSLTLREILVWIPGWICISSKDCQVGTVTNAAYLLAKVIFLAVILQPILSSSRNGKTEIERNLKEWPCSRTLVRIVDAT